MSMLALADGRRESVGESRCALALAVAGIRVVPQVEIRDEGGFLVARVDFVVAGTRVIIEFDGKLKYASGDPAVLWEEKRREDRLRPHGLRRGPHHVGGSRATRRGGRAGPGRAGRRLTSRLPGDRDSRPARTKEVGRTGGFRDPAGKGEAQMRLRALTASRSSASSATEASIFPREKSSISSPWTIDHWPSLTVTGNEEMSPS